MVVLVPILHINAINHFIKEEICIIILCDHQAEAFDAILNKALPVSDRYFTNRTQILNKIKIIGRKNMHRLKTRAVVDVTGSNHISIDAEKFPVIFINLRMCKKRLKGSRV